MRKTRWLFTLMLATFLCASPVMAAEPAKDTGKLEAISPAPANAPEKDCPMHKGQKDKCEHKNGEPCPYHKNEMHHGKAHDHCDHKHPA